MATPLTELASFPATSRSASVATRPDSVTPPFAGLTFTLVTVEKRASRKSFACNASFISAVSPCALRGCAVLQPAPPRTATTDASAANSTEVVLLLPLQFLPVFIEGPLSEQDVEQKPCRVVAARKRRRKRTAGARPSLRTVATASWQRRIECV